METSNLLLHLKTNHPNLFQEANQAMKSSKGPQNKTTSVVVGQPTIQETIERAQKYEWKGKEWKFSGSIAYCIAKDCLPINVVEGAGFKKMINTFDSRYEIPGHNHFSRIALPSIYTSVKQQVKHEISTFQYFSATTDLWSSLGTYLKQIY